MNGGYQTARVNAWPSDSTRARSRSTLVAACFTTLVIAACVADNPTGVAPSNAIRSNAPTEPTGVRSVLRDGDSHAIVAAQSFTIAGGTVRSPAVSNVQRLADDAFVARLHEAFVTHAPSAAITSTSGGAQHSLGGPDSRIEWATTGLAKGAVGGHAITVGVVYNPKRGEPPLGSVTFVDGKLSFVSEFQHARVNGKSHLRRVRVTAFDSSGRPATVLESEVDSTPPRVSSSVIGTLHGGALAVLPAIARLVEPDVLYAQSVTGPAEGSGGDNDEGRCETERNTMLVGAAASAGLLLEVAALRTALSAAEAAVMAACAEIPVRCFEVHAALFLAVKAAEQAVSAKAVQAAAAVVFAAMATKDYYNCMRKTPVVATTQQTDVGAPAGSGGDGGITAGSDDVAPPPIESCFIRIFWDNSGYIFKVEDPNGCLAGY